jgi:hypothetical protein
MDTRKEQISLRLKTIQQNISDVLSERTELTSHLSGALGTSFDGLDENHLFYIRHIVKCNQSLETLMDERRELRRERDSLSYCGNPDCCSHGAYAPEEYEEDGE